MNSRRENLISEIPWFIRAASRVQGVNRIAILGSVITEKLNPKDIDFLVTVDDDADLARLAKVGRQLKGHTGSTGAGADVFLANPDGHYIGRTCGWKVCKPGIRVSCDALNCGKRHYLHDDLRTITLSDDSVAQALELWPSRDENVVLPKDVERVLERLG